MSDAANHFKNFPTVDSAFGDNFTVLPTFVRTDTLEHLKNCGKNIRKSADAVTKDDVNYLRALCWASKPKIQAAECVKICSVGKVVVAAM